MRKNLQNIIFPVIIIAALFGLASCLSGSAGPSDSGDIAHSAPSDAGFLANESSDFTVVLAGADNKVKTLHSRNKKIALAPGNYTIGQVTLKKKDSLGKQWEIPSKYLNYKVTIEKGKTVTMNVGEPFEIVLEVSSGQMEFSFEGKSGEEYSYIIVNGRIQPPPSFTITDSSGKVLKTGFFRYG